LKATDKIYTLAATMKKQNSLTVRGWLLCVLPLLFVSCSVNGFYVYGGWPESQTIELLPDGRFEFEWWSDDGGTVCKAAGKWEVASRKPQRIITRVETVIRGTYGYGCTDLPTVESWEVSRSKLQRRENKIYTRTDKRGG
jgi:hypothetical protein